MPDKELKYLQDSQALNTTAPNDAQQERNDRQYKQDVNNAPNVKRKFAECPAYEQNDCDDIQ